MDRTSEEEAHCERVRRNPWFGRIARVRSWIERTNPKAKNKFLESVHEQIFDQPDVFPTARQSPILKNIFLHYWKIHAPITEVYPLDK